VWRRSPTQPSRKRRMTRRNRQAVGARLHSGMGAADQAARAGWRAAAFLSLLLAFAAGGYTTLLWQWKDAPAAPPCTPSLAVECPIPWLAEALTLAGFVGSLVGAAVSFFRQRQFGRWLLASVAVLGASVLAWLTEQWIASGE
jgi:hypothetical protein